MSTAKPLAVLNVRYMGSNISGFFKDRFFAQCGNKNKSQNGFSSFLPLFAERRALLLLSLPEREICTKLSLPYRPTERSFPQTKKGRPGQRKKSKVFLLGPQPPVKCIPTRAGSKSVVSGKAEREIGLRPDFSMSRDGRAKKPRGETTRKNGKEPGIYKA